MVMVIGGGCGGTSLWFCARKNDIPDIDLRSFARCSGWCLYQKLAGCRRSPSSEFPGGSGRTNSPYNVRGNPGQPYRIYNMLALTRINTS